MSPVALVTSVARGAALAVGEGSVTGTLGDPRGDRAAVLAAEGLLGRGAGGLVRAGSGEPDCAPEEDLLVQSFAARPRLLVFGATEFARPLAGIAAALGHRVTVCDARPAFALPERFPGADEVVTDRPDRWFRHHQDRVDGTTAVGVLTHDARFDVPVLALALGSRAGLRGAMGSRRTHEDRLVRLREAGLADAELARLTHRSGWTSAGAGPRRRALSIMAEIVAVRRGGSGLPLTAGERSRPRRGDRAALGMSGPAGAHPPGHGGISGRSPAGAPGRHQLGESRSLTRGRPSRRPRASSARSISAGTAGVDEAAVAAPRQAPEGLRPVLRSTSRPATASASSVVTVSSAHVRFAPMPPTGRA
ncbi:hypothetical protein GCM10020227_53060 [Streptomyces flavovirens]